MQNHIVAKVFLENTANEILILRRSRTAPERPLKWDLPGGWVVTGEDPLNACKRELLEEAGIEAEGFVQVCTFTKDIDDHTLTYVFAKTQAESNKVVLSYEHDTYLWVTKREYLDYITHEPQMDAFKEVYQVA